MHRWWYCDLIWNFWKQITYRIYPIAGQTLKEKPEDLLLNHWDRKLIPTEKQHNNCVSKKVKGPPAYMY